MEQEELQTIVVDEHLVEWREKNREVTINGEYFDLTSWRLEDGKYTFSGVFDEEETAVMELLGKQNQFWNSIISLLLIGQCFAAFVVYYLYPLYFTSLRKSFSIFLNYYDFLFKKIISPPPRVYGL